MYFKEIKGRNDEKYFVTSSILTTYLSFLVFFISSLVVDFPSGTVFFQPEGLPLVSLWDRYANHNFL
jgi:hypothetical protein